MQQPPYNSQNCPITRYVTSHPWGSSVSGTGCQATGGHCLPSDSCGEMIAQVSKQKEIESTIIWVNNENV